jgi:hypothetical protein
MCDTLWGKQAAWPLRSLDTGISFVRGSGFWVVWSSGAFTSLSGEAWKDYNDKCFFYVNASCAVLRSELYTNGNPQEFVYRPRKQHLRKSSCELELRSTATQYSSNHIFSPIDLTLSSTLTENTQTPDSLYPSDPATPGSRASHTPAALSKQLSWHSAACNTSR